MQVGQHYCQFLKDKINGRRDDVDIFLKTRLMTETRHKYLTESADTVKPLLKASKVGTISLGHFMESGMGGSGVGLDKEGLSFHCI